MKPKTRLTKQRQAILQVFHQQDSLMTAQEVYELVRLTHPRMSLGTIYRNLELLTIQSFLAKIVFPDGKARFELIHSEKPNHHLICLSCGQSVHIPWCPINEKMTAFMNGKYFTPQYHQFDIFGICSECKQNSSITS